MNETLQAFCARVEAYNESRPSEERVEIEYNEPMSRHTSFRIGGPAALYLCPASADEVRILCAYLKETGAKHTFLGNGSNVLFDDEGYDGAVIAMTKLNAVEVRDNILTAGAGASVASLCKAARDASLTGLEFAYGIPGSVGGAVYMNAGAYGGETAFVLRDSTYLDMTDLSVHTIPLADHAYGYRESVYKHNPRVILSASFELKMGEKEEITAQMNDFMNRRVTKQPLEYPSAGSVFKRYPGRFTGQMIEECGLKGYTIGGAQVSEKHAGFIVNRGGATCRDVLDLIEHIKKVILENCGCELECEVIHIS